jgi:tripartite-type tricarboxylate transporter receptor subunit TctC
VGATKKGKGEFSMKRFLALLIAVCSVMPLFAGGEKEAASANGSSVTVKTAADAAAYLKGRNIRVALGTTSVTTDTYVTADAFARHVSLKYGCNIKVDPIGTGRALEEVISARPDGNTIMMLHDLTYLGVLFGAYEEGYKLENMIVGGSIAHSTSDAVAASASAPYKTVAEMGKWLKDNPRQIVTYALAAGGISQLCFNAIYDWINKTYGQSVSSRLKVFVTNGTSTDVALQALWDGNCNVFYSVAAPLQEYTREGVEPKLKLNILGVASGERHQNEPWPTFSEQGITFLGKPFVFSKDYFVYYPIGVPVDFIAAMDIVIEDVCKSQEYIAAIKKLGFVAQAMGSKEAKGLIYAKRTLAVDLIEKGPNLDDLVK